LIELHNQDITLRNQLSTEVVDKPGLDKFRGNGRFRSRTREIDTSLAQQYFILT